MPTVPDIHRRGTRAAQPAAIDVTKGTLYFVTDEALTERSDGTTWEAYGGGPAGGGPVGDVVGPASSGDLRIAVFDGITGKLLKDGGATITEIVGGGGGGTPDPHATSHELGGTDVLSVAGLSGLLADGQTPLAHHVSHEPGGPDAITALNGNVITTGTVAAARLPPRVGALGLIIDGGGAVITPGVKGFLEVPFACTITAVTLLATDPAVTPGSIVIDIWKDTYANYPPVVGDSIVASAKPTLASATKSRDTTLTGWTTAIAAGDVLGFKVDSVATLTKVALSLTVQAL